MRAVRPLASGLVYAVVRVLLVIGSLSLALAEQPQPTSATIPIATRFSTRTRTPTAPATRVTTAAPETATVSPTSTYADTLAAPTSTLEIPPAYTPAQAGSQPCGPYRGWIKAYTVRRGDTLFRIAMMFRTTAAALVQANCRTSSLIYAGERLWVPSSTAPRWGPPIISTFEMPTEWSTETGAPIETETLAP